MPKFGNYLSGKKTVVDNWANLKTSISTQVDAPYYNYDFRRNGIKGIWGLDATSEFPGDNRPTNVELIASNFVTNGTTLTVPAHQEGDTLLFMNGSQTLTPPVLTSGFTDIGSAVSDTITDRALRLQYRISDGTIASLTTTYYGIVIVLRNAQTLLQSAFYQSNSSSNTTIPLPTLPNPTNKSGNSAIIVGTYVGGTITAVNPTSFAVINSSFGIRLNNTGDYPASPTISGSGNLSRASWAVEFIS